MKKTSLRFYAAALFVFAIQASAAPYQAVMTASNKATVAIPASAPYSTLTTWRLDWRATITAANASAWSGFNQYLVSINGGSYNIRPYVVVAGVSYTYLVQDNQDSPTFQFGCGTILFGQDSVFRVQKTGTTVTCESWNVDGSNYQLASGSGFTSGTNGLAGTLQLGDAAYAQGTLAFFRGYSSNIALNSKPPFGGTGGDLWDYEYGNNLNDSSGHGLNLSGTGSFSYSLAATYAPACVLSSNALPFYASAGMTPNANNSFPLNGNTTLTYSWANVSNTFSNPAPTITGGTTASPLFTGLIGPSSYIVQLTVTDSGSSSNSCQQKYGVVSADAAGNITNLTAAQKLIYAPGLQVPQNTPWTQFDVLGPAYGYLMLQKMADPPKITAITSSGNTSTLTFASTTGAVSGGYIYITGATGSGCSGLNSATWQLSNVNFAGTSGQIAFAGCTYTASSATAYAATGSNGYAQYGFVDYWNQAQVGTITVTSGSQTVVGSGTSFTTLFCQGPGSPNLPKNNGSTKIVVWYPIDPSFGYPAGTTGRRGGVVNSCTDDTHINVSFDIGGSGWLVDTYVLAGSGLNYAYVEQNQDVTTPFGIAGWGSDASSSPGNYYDNSSSLDPLWLRYGIDNFLTGYQRMADDWFSYMITDKGMCAQTSTGNTCIADARMASLDGIMLRNFDSPPFDYSPGIRATINNYTGAGTPAGSYHPTNWVGNTGAVPIGGVYASYGGSTLTFLVQDVRPQGYQLDYTAKWGLLDSNATQKAACATAVSNDIKYRWNDSTSQNPGGWSNSDTSSQTLNNISLDSWTTLSGVFPNYTAGVTNGSSIVTPQSSHSWNVNQFNQTCGLGGSACSLSNPPFVVLFCSTGTAIPSHQDNSQCDKAWYYASLNSGTGNLILTQVDGQTPVLYTGTTNATSGWTIRTTILALAYNGYYVQPYMQVMPVRGLYYASQLLRTAQLTGGGYDFVGPITAQNLAAANANWMVKNGIDWTPQPAGALPVARGLYYIQDSPDCVPNGLANVPGGSCGNIQGIQSERALNGEGLGVFVYACALNPAMCKSWIPVADQMFSAMFGSQGEQLYDGVNIITQQAGLNQYMFTGGGQQKWFGYYWRGDLAKWIWLRNQALPGGVMGGSVGLSIARLESPAMLRWKRGF